MAGTPTPPERIYLTLPFDFDDPASIPATPKEPVESTEQDIQVFDEIAAKIDVDSVRLDLGILLTRMPFEEFRDEIIELSERALEKGYRQALNFAEAYDEEGKWKPDTFDEQKVLLQYTNKNRETLPVNYNDPTECVTKNKGMVMYQKWFEAWGTIMDDYMVDSLLPDFRCLNIHKEQTFKVIRVVRKEVKKLQRERARTRIYKPEQIDMIRRGIRQRKMWYKDLADSIDHIETFQLIFNTWPEDAMCPHRWFQTFKRETRDIDFGMDP
ncbi:hypothetical protein ABW19_dt0208974 [Dactylella cylindrospora]|nr:hypothetical protein ABW19_dt0208974 [Dactylella cylindrospora]